MSVYDALMDAASEVAQAMVQQDFTDEVTKARVIKARQDAVLHLVDALGAAEADQDRRAQGPPQPYLKGRRPVLYETITINPWVEHEFIVGIIVEFTEVNLAVVLRTAETIRPLATWLTDVAKGLEQAEAAAAKQRIVKPGDAEWRNPRLRFGRN